MRVEMSLHALLIRDLSGNKRREANCKETIMNEWQEQKRCLQRWKSKAQSQINLIRKGWTLSNRRSMLRRDHTNRFTTNQMEIRSALTGPSPLAHA